MNVDVTKARQALTDHPHYKYRGCAPDSVEPSRAAGDLDLLVDAWSPYTGDGAEPQKVRVAREAAAKTVCGVCPVLVECRVWANQTTDEGRLAEPEGVAGGQTALERHRGLIASRRSQAVPGRGDTDQKRAVLEALAGSSDPRVVADRAGMDVRTANWHRSKLCGVLGLNRESATREDLLAAARRHGLLDRAVRVVADGVRPVAAAPTTDGARQRRVRSEAAVQLTLPDVVALDSVCDDLMERAA